jgi:hypothetical protein
MAELTTDPNSYQALREANIARNEARLRALGLSKFSASKNQGRNNELSTQAQNRRRSTKRPRQQENQQRQQYATRRSTRLTQKSSLPSSVHPSAQPSDDSTMQESLPQETDQESNTNVRANKLMTVEDIQKEVESHPLSVPLITPPKSSANSARSMTLDVEKLLYGPNGLLGKIMTKTGKAFVMEESARLAVNNIEVFNGSISFNKYSGVQEWSNAAIFLWVNLHAPDSEVTNEFSHSGRHVSWFGGTRMHDATPAICRLKQIGVAAATGKLRPSEGVVLWCRVYNAHQKAFGAYICLGRLSVRSFCSFQTQVRHAFIETSL